MNMLTCQDSNPARSLTAAVEQPRDRHESALGCVFPSRRRQHFARIA